MPVRQEDGRWLPVSDVSKTNAELVAEARLWANGHPNRYSGELVDGLADALDRATRCSCPTGDGSLRWPCPAHPPTPAPVPAQGEANNFAAELQARGDAELLRMQRNDIQAMTAAIERVRALHVGEWQQDWVTGMGGTVCRACRVPIESEPCDTIAALAGAPEPDGEWEYQRIDPRGEPVWGVHFDEVPLLDEGWTVARRIKAGPWEPIKGESE